VRRIDKWLEEYGESHRDSTNKTVHWICVPAIVFSILGLLWSIPKFHLLTIVPHLNWATLAVILALIYYISLSLPLAVGMAVVSAVMLFALRGLAVAGAPLVAVCLVLFTLAWVGQFVGHKVEGKRPSFFKDLQFLLIGPVWLLSFIYKKVGIRY
jgi:uncharacterized membrane protein YGL010W